MSEVTPDKVGKPRYINFSVIYLEVSYNALESCDRTLI